MNRHLDSDGVPTIEAIRDLLEALGPNAETNRRQAAPAPDGA